MKSLPSALTPFVRSDAVGALLAETLGHPEREVSLSELARRTGVALPVVHREVTRLVESEVLADRAEGRNRMVRANDSHPLFHLMRDLVDATYGPVPVLRELFRPVAGVEDLIIYGSWAARRAGQPGPFPNDLDVLAVGTAGRRDLAQVATLAGERLQIPVNVTRLAPEEWSGSDPSPFVRTLRSRPYLDVSSGELHA